MIPGEAGETMKKQAGFTLIELLVTSAIAMVVLAAVYELFINTNKIYTVQSKVVNLQQGIRGAVNLMAQDIRMAGLNPTGEAGNATIQSANATSIRVAYDYNASGACDRDALYVFDASGDRLTMDGTTLSDGIASFDLQYTLADGTTTANPADPAEIRGVDINVCGRISGSYADEFNSTYCFTRGVTCRNMGI
jgi:prepilin-type N-terminal cleavage/methylation domain-containing protein